MRCDELWRREEEVQTLLDDHTIKIQTVKGSPFAKPFIDWLAAPPNGSRKRRLELRRGFAHWTSCTQGCSCSGGGEGRDNPMGAATFWVNPDGNHHVEAAADETIDKAPPPRPPGCCTDDATAVVKKVPLALPSSLLSCSVPVLLSSAVQFLWSCRLCLRESFPIIQCECARPVCPPACMPCSCADSS